MISEATIQTARAAMEGMLQRYRLPLRSRIWRGGVGHLKGAGAGSSIDFQDHRPYMPGDDPRAIDWQAYARSGNYNLKLYQEEVSPNIDLVLDTSASMFVTEEKAVRTLELFFFGLGSGLRCRGGLRLFFLNGEKIQPLSLDEAFSPARLKEVLEEVEAKGEGVPRFDRIPWRGGSLRLWISDLLFPGNASLSPFGSGKGRGLLWVPYSDAEADPDWDGNIEFHDCEGSERRTQRVNAPLLEAYRTAYERHFALWREEARRHGVGLARIPSGRSFAEALAEEAIPLGAVEVV